MQICMNFICKVLYDLLSFKGQMMAVRIIVLYDKFGIAVEKVLINT
jgi:hypothetical protein